MLIVIKILTETPAETIWKIAKIGTKNELVITNDL